MIYALSLIHIFLNCPWTGVEEIAEHIPASMKRDLYNKHAQFYVIDAAKLAAEIGLGKRINNILQAAFFSLTKVMPLDTAVEDMKKNNYNSYLKKAGQKIVDLNNTAVDIGITAQMCIRDRAYIVGCVISSGLFGDQCSPISDTTILSSTGASCNHIVHVMTQIPYGVTVGISAFIGYLFGGLTGQFVLSIGVTFGVLLVALRGLKLLHRKTKDADTAAA